MKCKHCGSEFEGKFCPECGTRAELETTVVSQNAQEQKDAAQQNFPVFKAKPAGGTEKSQRNRFIKEGGFCALLSFWHWEH